MHDYRARQNILSSLMSNPDMSDGEALAHLAAIVEFEPTLAKRTSRTKKRKNRTANKRARASRRRNHR